MFVLDDLCKTSHNTTNDKKNSTSLMGEKIGGPEGQTFASTVDHLVGLAPEDCKECPVLRILATKLASRAIMGDEYPAELSSAELRIRDGGFLECEGPVDVKRKGEPNPATPPVAITGCRNKVSNTPASLT